MAKKEKSADAKPTKTRVYVVTDSSVGAEALLIRAATKAQAVRHYTRGKVSASVASQDDIIAAMGNGVSVVDASTDDE